MDSDPNPKPVATPAVTGIPKRDAAGPDVAKPVVRVQDAKTAVAAAKRNPADAEADAEATAAITAADAKPTAADSTRRVLSKLWNWSENSRYFDTAWGAAAATVATFDGAITVSGATPNESATAVSAESDWTLGGAMAAVSDTTSIKSAAAVGTLNGATPIWSAAAVSAECDWTLGGTVAAVSDATSIKSAAAFGTLDGAITVVSGATPIRSAAAVSGECDWTLGGAVAAVTGAAPIESAAIYTSDV